MLVLVVAFLLLLTPSITISATVVDLGNLQLSPVVNVVSPPITDLGMDRIRGVEAQAQLVPQPFLDISNPLESGLNHYLISVEFLDEASGKALPEGQVAARTFTLENHIADTVRLEPQENQWRGALILSSNWETLIKVGCKLSDGKKRIYRFFFNPQPVTFVPKELPPVE